eukprot:2960645-Prymnesium_polylepis.1
MQTAQSAHKRTRHRSITHLLHHRFQQHPQRSGEHDASAKLRGLLHPRRHTPIHSHEAKGIANHANLDEETAVRLEAVVDGRAVLDRLVVGHLGQPAVVPGSSRCDGRLVACAAQSSR